MTNEKLTGTLSAKKELTGSLNFTTASDYSALSNKPKLNGKTIEGSMTADDLTLVNSDNIVTDEDVDKIIYGGL